MSLATMPRDRWPHQKRPPATVAAPRSVVRGFGTIPTGSGRSRSAIRPLSVTAAVKEPSRSFGRIFGAIRMARDVMLEEHVERQTQKSHPQGPDQPPFDLQCHPSRPLALRKLDRRHDVSLLAGPSYRLGTARARDDPLRSEFAAAVIPRDLPAEDYDARRLRQASPLSAPAFTLVSREERRC